MEIIKILSFLCGESAAHSTSDSITFTGPRFKAVIGKENR